MSMKRSTHLSDDRLIELCFESTPTPAEHTHLDGCARCVARHARVHDLLHEVADAGSQQADAVFTDERLARQQARILQRLDHEGRPARVIAFPAGQPAEMRPLRTRPATRWIAGAAAAGLAIGLLAGHLAHDLRSVSSSRNAALRTTSSRPVPPTALRAATVTISDDEFLGQIEMALDVRVVSALEPLHDLTPR